MSVKTINLNLNSTQEYEQEAEDHISSRSDQMNYTIYITICFYMPLKYFNSLYIVIIRFITMKNEGSLKGSLL